MPEKIKRGVVENRGTAIILSLIIVTVLFILTSFLIRKVVTNTMMVRKAKEEQKSYALAKQGILYALDRLNTWDGTDPDYDPTAWLNGQNWDEDNWNPFDLNSDGENDLQIRVDKDDIPHPEDNDPAFDPEDDDNGDLNYITIESQDLPKKLVTLQAIAKNTSPLLKYVRFINSDTVFENNTFGLTGTLIQGDAPLCVLGDVTWESGSSNNLILSGSDSKAIIYGKISNGGVNSLQINSDDPDNGYYYFFDPNDSSYNDPAVFDTAYGRYFSSAHLPSCYDYSSGTPTFYDGSTRVTFWPQIKEERFWDSLNGTTRLADIAISSDDCGKRGMNDDVAPYYWWDDWYPSDDSHDYGYVHIDGSTVDDVYWRREVSTDSYNYTPPGVHLILSASQDLDPLTSGFQNLLRINDSSTTDTPAEYENSATASSFSGDVIFTEKDIRLNGVLPRSLSVASGGNIYIDSNIYTNGYSLALLAKENVLLNTTHRWVMDYEGGDNWNDDGTSAANLIGVTNGVFARAEVSIGESKIQIVNFGGSASRQIVTTDRIILRGCVYEVFTDKTLNLSVEVDLGDDSWQSASYSSSPTFSISGSASGTVPEIVFETPSTFRSFSRIKLTAIGGDAGDDPAGWIEVDALEIPVRNMDNTVIFAERGSLYLIAGDGSSNNNNQQEAFTLNAALSQEKLEEMAKWNDGSGGEADWDQITYVYDPDAFTSPPPALPPSVNLVSLKRKGEG